MGNFYTNITLKGPGQDQVAEFLNQEGRSALVSPTVNGCTAVFDEESESQDDQVLTKLAASLSKRFQCPALSVINHDDDILVLLLYTAGKITDAYNSCPNYFEGGEGGPEGGDAKRLCAAFGVPAAAEQVEAILRKPGGGQGGYVFAFERHEALAQALNLPSFVVAAGYNYLSQGEVPPGLEQGLVETG